MFTSRVIAPGDLVVKDPSSVIVYRFDWTTLNLPAEVAIVESTFTITAIRPSKTDTALVKDFENDPDDGYVRLSGGTLGQTYEIANKIVTDETPAQTEEISFRLLIQNR